MKNRFSIVTIIWLFSILIISCQNHAHLKENNNKTIATIPPPPAIDDTVAYNKYLRGFECIHNGQLSLKERTNRFPFNKAKKVVLVSYQAGIIKVNDSVECYSQVIPQINGKIDFSSFKEMVTLDKKQIDTLTDILYNINYRNNETSTVEHCNCDFPTENAIVFLDNKNNCFAYIELCFATDDYNLMPDTMNLGGFCKGKFQMIKNFISRQGIEYGFIPPEI